ncbi:hypothetical protein ACVUNM_004046 [Raoultella ornithinolytica]|uniref:hypothetical protein n=1 Tax=Klebsiella grimontii TaxID=2058152 RepID=UPI001D0F1FA7|nr:hypothetical protein [Klebsiella grimontii]
MNAFYYGINLGWVAGVFLALFAVGSILIATILVIPEKYHSRFNIVNTFIWSFLSAMVGLGGTITILTMTVSRDDLEVGRHWKTECRLMEENIQTGVFLDPVNKLDCAGIIINIPSGQYYRYISEWELYKRAGK